MANKRPAKPVRNRARKVAVASGIIAGKPLNQIAQEAGVSRWTAGRDAESPEVRQILTVLISDKVNLLGTLLSKVLVTIEDALQAQVFSVGKGAGEGLIYTIGPDHYARLAACKRFIEITTAGRPLPKPPEPRDERRTITLAEFQELVSQYQADQKAGPCPSSPQSPFDKDQTTSKRI